MGMDHGQLVVGADVIGALAAIADGNHELAKELSARAAAHDTAEAVACAVGLGGTFLRWAAAAHGVTPAELLADLRRATAE